MCIIDSLKLYKHCTIVDVIYLDVAQGQKYEVPKSLFNVIDLASQATFTLRCRAYKLDMIQGPVEDRTCYLDVTDPAC